MINRFEYILFILYKRHAPDDHFPNHPSQSIGLFSCLPGSRWFHLQRPETSYRKTIHHSQCLDDLLQEMTKLSDADTVMQFETVWVPCCMPPVMWTQWASVIYHNLMFACLVLFSNTTSCQCSSFQRSLNSQMGMTTHRKQHWYIYIFFFYL